MSKGFDIPIFKIYLLLKSYKIEKMYSYRMTNELTAQEIIIC